MDIENTENIKKSDEYPFYSWIKDGFSGYTPDRATAIKALRHMRSYERKNLFANDMMRMRTAEGYWYEYLIYEHLIDLMSSNSQGMKMVQKGCDVTTSHNEKYIGTNGMYSSELHDIRVRGNGTDLAEVDLLLFDNNNRVIFCEIITSGTDLRDLEMEIIYKKHILGYIFKQEHVGFILFSAISLTNTYVIQRLSEDADNLYVETQSCEIMKSVIKSLNILSLPTAPVQNQNLIPLESLQLQPFNYKKLHDTALAHFYSAIDNFDSANVYLQNPEVSQFVKKILCGSIFPFAIRELLTQYTFRIKTQFLSDKDILTNFSKIIIAVNLPEFEPIIYLKPRKKRTYYKMIIDKTNHGFKYERDISHHVGFYLWLEQVKPSLDLNQTLKILKYCKTHMKLYRKVDYSQIPQNSQIPSQSQYPLHS